MASKSSERKKLNPQSKLHQMRERRHRNGRDLKVVITQRNSETGGGKTTLAVWLALNWDRHGWDGQEKGTVSVNEFLDVYPDLPKHSVLIMDEAEELDARRSMKSENVEFSKHWMTMRTRQIDSILTLPTSSALDKRLLELADIRINVVSRGVANVYRVKVDDHHPQDGPQQWFMHEIEWPDLSEHPEYLKLDDQKQQMIDDELDYQSDDGDSADKELTPKEVAQAIEDDEGIEYYIEENNGGAQIYINKSLIRAEYDVSGEDAKAVKSLLKRRTDKDVM